MAKGRRGGERWRREMLEKYESELEGLTILDDRFMATCLKGQLDCLELMVRIVLGDEGVRLADARAQEVLPQVLGRSVQLDFLCEGTDGRRFVVEFESTSERFPPRRARFYASMADAASLAAGEGYAELPDVVLVVFCSGDPFGDGLRAHTFRRFAEETGAPLGDGSAIIYVSCKDPDDTPLGRLAHDLTCADPGEMHYKLLADRVRAVKERRGDMNALQEMYEAGREDGREAGMEAGMEAGRTNTIFSLVERGLLGADVAARELGMDEQRFASEAGAYAAALR